jgi:N-acetylneuraminic acid mutarotase
VVQGKAPQLTGHTVTLLKNGEVLIVGGHNANDAGNEHKAAAYRYRPTQDDFVDAGKMGTPRVDHATAIMSDGRVLVTGGKNASDYLQSTEIYDPSKPAASAWTKGPDMFKPRWQHTATFLQTGDVLIAGGFTYSDSTNTMIIYSAATNGWKVPKALLTDGRKAHTATLLKNGKVLFTGGNQGASSNPASTTYLDSTEVYDPATGTFAASSPKMSKKRVGHTATLMKNGQVLIVGGWCGHDCAGGKLVDDIYDPSTNTITPLAHPGDLPNTHVAVLLNDGRVFVVTDGSSTDNKNTVAYSPGGGGMWDVLPKLNQGRWSAGGTLLQDGTVFVVGGLVAQGSVYADKAERFE